MMALPLSYRRSTRSGRVRGSALIVALFAAVLIAGLGVAFLTEGMAARGTVGRHESSLRALEIAEAGIARAEAEVRAQVDHDTDGIGTASGPYGNGDYEVTVRPDPVSDDRWALEAVGRHVHGVRRIEVGIRRRQTSMFVEALFSQDVTLLNGDTKTDAYDSRLGTYTSQATNADAHGTYASQGGDIGSNGTIELTGSSLIVRGDAIPGALSTLETHGAPTVVGDAMAREMEIPVEPLPFSDFQTAFLTNANATLATGGQVKYNAARYSLEIGGNAVFTLNAGTYFFSSLTLKGGATLRVNGPVRIFVTESVDLAGGTLTNPGAPGNLAIFAHPYPLPTGTSPTSTLVKVAGGADARMAVYGPGADVKITGGGDFYGAVVGKTIDLQGNAFFHYDRALGSFGVHSVATLERLYWRDLAPPRR